MHEFNLLKDILDKTRQLAALENKPLTAINLQLGALAHISADHLLEHWQQAVDGTPLQSVQVTINELPGLDHPQAQDIILESLEFEQSDED